MIEQEKVLRELARKHGINIQQAKDIEDSMKFVAHAMKESVDREANFFPSIRVPFFGLFHCPERVAKKMKEITERNKK